MSKTHSLYKKIEACSKCSIHCNQKPLVMKKAKAGITWVGLSSVKSKGLFDDVPLSEHTRSGYLISEIEKELEDYEFYRTNLVKCLPLDENDKIRYPRQEEMSNCSEYLLNEIELQKPKVVFLLGRIVADKVLRSVVGIKSFSLSNSFTYESYTDEKGVIYVPIHHPSYILVYKRKSIESYINGVSRLVKSKVKPNSVYQRETSSKMAYA